MSINKVIILGRLGQDPELKYTPGGVAVATFSVATSEFWKDKDDKKQERTEWHRCVVWGQLAENVSKYVKKGQQIYLEGKNQTREWEDKDKVKRYTTEVIVSSVQFIGSKEEGSTRPPAPTEPPPTYKAQEEGEKPNYASDEIPF